MGNTEKIQQFEGPKVRVVWNEDEEKWYFSVKRCKFGVPNSAIEIFFISL